MCIRDRCADLMIFHKTRKKPKGSVETFSGKKLAPGDYESFPITTEDFGMVMLHLGERARGAFTVSQVSAGSKNHFAFEIFGTKAGIAWNQESPDTLWTVSYTHLMTPSRLSSTKRMRAPEGAR